MVKGSAVAFLAMLGVVACGPARPRHDTSSIEAQPLSFVGFADHAKVEALDAIDGQKSMWLERYLWRAANCTQATEAGRRISKSLASGKLKCIATRGAIPIDDAQFGTPIARTVGEAIAQQKKIEETFKGETGDARFGEGEGTKDQPVYCHDIGPKIACEYTR